LKPLFPAPLKKQIIKIQAAGYRQATPFGGLIPGSIVYAAA